MRYLFIAFLFVSLFGHSQGIEPSSFQGNPNKGGFLKGVTLNVDDFGDTTYLYVHVDSTALADSIYLRGDSLILLKNGSGQVYKARIYDYNQTSVYYYDIPNPQKWDIYVDDQYDSSGKNRYYDGSSWQIFDYDGYVGNEGRLYVLDGTSYNTARIRSYHGDYTDAVLKGDSLVKVNSVFDSNILDINIDTVNLLDLTTQYLNPYVITGDTVGFYLTVAVDTVLFENTIDTAAYCCPPSLSGDTLYIDDNYVVLPVANIIGGWGIDATESPANTWNLIGDSSQVATQYDISGLVSGSGTATRLAFWSGTSTLSSNANLYWDNTNSRLGIGTASPSKQLTTTQDISANGNDIGLGGGNQPNNARFGNAALNNNTTGVGNLAIGAYALLNNTTGYYNIALGNQAMFYNVSGHTNTAIGQNTLVNNTGSKNTGIGTEALYSLTSGVENTAISALALRSNVTGNSNIAIGYGAGYYETGSGKLYIEPSTSSTPLIGGDFVTRRVGINTAIGSIARTLHVTGEARITDLITDPPTGLVGHDEDGDLGSVALSGLSMVSGTLTNSFNGDITAVTVTAPLTGGGTSGSVSVGLIQELRLYKKIQRR